MRRIFITGIAGFLGSHLADWFLARNCEVIGCDDLSTGSVANIPDGVQFAQIDISGIWPGLLRDIDVVFHVAAAAYEGASVFSPAFISQNIYAGSAAVFSAAIAAHVQRIVFTSSMARYGERQTDITNAPRLFSEEMIPQPVDPYGIAKEAAERLLINLCETHGMPWAIAVPHNIYGPRQRYVDPCRNVAAIFANLMLQGRRPFIYGDGSQLRCFSYVDDVVPYLARMGFDEFSCRETINLGPDVGACSVLDLGEMIAEIIGVEFEPIFLPPRPCEVKVALCSSRKARSLLGFEQKTGLREGLEALVQYIAERGPKPFEYQLPIEIQSDLVPRTWADRAM